MILTAGPREREDGIVILGGGGGGGGGQQLPDGLVVQPVRQRAHGVVVQDGARTQELGELGHLHQHAAVQQVLNELRRGVLRCRFTHRVGGFVSPPRQRVE